MNIKVEYILIESDFPQEEVYNKIGLEGEIDSMEEKLFPTMSGMDYTRAKECSITYSTGYMESIEVEKVIEKLSKKLQPKETEIVGCIKEYKLRSKFCIVINLTDNPIIKLPADFVDMASRFGADIEFDSYIDGNQVGKSTKLFSWLRRRKFVKNSSVNQSDALI